MNSLRIRVAKLETVTDDKPYGVQVSIDGLMWWTISRHGSAKEAMEQAKIFEKFTIDNQLLKATHIFLQTRI